MKDCGRDKSCQQYHRVQRFPQSLVCYRWKTRPRAAEEGGKDTSSKSPLFLPAALAKLHFQSLVLSSAVYRRTVEKPIKCENCSNNRTNKLFQQLLLAFVSIDSGSVRYHVSELVLVRGPMDNNQPCIGRTLMHNAEHSSNGRPSTGTRQHGCYDVQHKVKKKLNRQKHWYHLVFSPGSPKLPLCCSAQWKQVSPRSTGAAVCSFTPNSCFPSSNHFFWVSSLLVCLPPIHKEAEAQGNATLVEPR